MARAIPVGEVIEGYPEEPRLRTRRIPVGQATEVPMSAADRARFGLPPEAQPRPLGSAGPQYNRANAGSYVSNPTPPNSGPPRPTAIQSLRSAAAPTLEKAGKFVRGSVPVAAGVSALTTGATPTEQYEKRFGFGRNEYDGFGGFLRDVGVRALGAASDLGNALTFGQAGKFYQDLQEAPAAPATAPATAAAPGDAYSNEGRNYSTAAAPALRDYTRSGNTFTDGSTSKTPNVTVVGGPTAYERQLAADYEDRVQREGNRGPTELSSSFRNDLDRRNFETDIASREFDARLAAAGGSRRGLARAAQITEQIESLRKGNTEEMINAARERGANARLNAELRTRSNEAAMNREVTMRGQDIVARGQDTTARTAAAKARYDMAKDDREFGLKDREANEKATQAAQASTQKWLESVFRTKDDKGNDVADAGKIATFTQGATRMLGGMIQQLAASGDPEKIKYAKLLSERGLAALDDEDRATMLTLFARQQRFNEARGILPGTASGPQSSNLGDFAVTGVDKGVLQDRYRLAGGQSIGVKDLEFDSPSNVILPNVLKTPTSDMRITPREAERLRRGY